VGDGVDLAWSRDAMVELRQSEEEDRAPAASKGAS
jgi:hypothetical protein